VVRNNGKRKVVISMADVAAPVYEQERLLQDMTIEELKESIVRLRARRAVARERRRVTKTGGEIGPDGAKPKRVRKGKVVIEDMDDMTMSFLLGDTSPEPIEEKEEEDEEIADLLGG
jgi:hypothetical protein